LGAEPLRTLAVRNRAGDSPRIEDLMVIVKGSALGRGGAGSTFAMTIKSLPLINSRRETGSMGKAWHKGQTTNVQNNTTDLHRLFMSKSISEIGGGNQSTKSKDWGYVLDLERAAENAISKLASAFR
jgi:hypothetical protein